MGDPIRLRVDCLMSGMRFDAMLRELFPDMGVRGWRRLINRKGVLVNGRPGNPGTTMHAGDVVEVVSGKAQNSRHGEVPQARLLGMLGGFYFFAKPALLHTVRVAGSGNPSLEEQLSHLIEPVGRKDVDVGTSSVSAFHCSPIRLLQRLDYETSGIVAGAPSRESQACFRAFERTGCVSKRYVCLLEGELQDEVVVASRIVSEGAGRGRVRVLEENDPDPSRQTLLRPLCDVTCGELPFGVEGADRLMLVGVVIRRGSRHQIRAHAASFGHPLLGDGLYGAKGYIIPDSGGAGVVCPPFFLHHGRITFGGLSMMLHPAWSLPAECRVAMGRWFAEET